MLQVSIASNQHKSLPNYVYERICAGFLCWLFVLGRCAGKISRYMPGEIFKKSTPKKNHIEIYPISISG
jgi:hypothetical protein